MSPRACPECGRPYGRSVTLPEGIAYVHRETRTGRRGTFAAYQVHDTCVVWRSVMRRDEDDRSWDWITVVLLAAVLAYWLVRVLPALL